MEISDDNGGWTNRATWNVSLWFRNDEYVSAMVDSLKMTDASQYENFCRYIWKEATPDGDSLDDVNWEEIASWWGQPE